MNLINKLSDFIGKKEVKDTLQVYIDACNKLNKPLDHCLLYGLPGTGKTTLAKIIANELNTKIKITQGSMVQKPIDVINLLLSLNQNEILFIDEIHAVNKQCFELFYSAMEEGYVDIAIGKDFNSKMARIKLPVFTLIAATTNLGKIPQPLEDRFGIFINMSEYSKTEISDIIKFYGNKLGVIFSNDDLLTLIYASKGIPRIAYKLVRRALDFRLNNKDIQMSEILSKLGIIYEGIDKNDYSYLKLLQNHSTPIGLKTISQTINIDEETIQYKIEPYLLKNEYIIKTSKGRKLTNKGNELIIKINQLFLK
ncbi:MAG: Holliday junction branch migration DNA helicase RuvB [Malacoplasma sp.]|nr:Holliday junction branch migration DNA helicase RuvB [Mycoplasmataceae bacterium]MDY2887562.1 Holliday junction branch migration DNA helicase RuvB [Malacoplasma sp.]